MAISARVVEWQPVRDAYIRRSPRPTYAELATEYSVPAGSIGAIASEEAWPAMRAQYLEAQLAAGDAASVLLGAIRGDRSVTQAYLALAVVTLATLQATVESVQASDRAESTKAEVINTCMFAAKNLADSLKTVGVIGISKTLEANGKEANGRWNPEMLQQINVTVQNLTAQTKGDTAVPTQVTKVETPGETA